MIRDMRSFTRIEADGSVTSVQSLEVPGVRVPSGPALEALLRELAPAYTAWISRLTAGVVEIREEPSGKSRARVRPIGPTGLLLGPPRLEGTSLVREILEGVLVSRQSGTLVVRLEPSARGVKASVELRGFRPRVLDIPGVGLLMFRKTQDVIHVRHSHGFLRHEVAPRLRRLAPLEPPSGAREPARLAHAGAL